MDKNFIREIVKDEIHYCTIVKPNMSNEGLNFVTNDEKSLQVGIWNYEKGKNLEPHFHNTYDRNADITSESVFITKGKILIKVYTKNLELVLEETLQAGEMIIQFYGVHEYIMLEDSIVVETKNGPYAGPDKDRTRVQIG
tara:strand:- start:1626 stop:2045 length:420 start_codon:yes stop_codon:yes gene_type:complete